jgi:3-oxoisoapionate decarboxylase
MMKRRSFLSAASGGILPVKWAAGEKVASPMGIVIHSYARRWQGKDSSVKYPPFENALDVLDHCQQMGAGGLQIGVDGWSADFAGKVRDTRESYGLYFEGSVSLPKTEGEVSAFDKAIRLGKEAGAVVFRSYLGGRRYEDFSKLTEFKAYKEQALRSLQLAEPIARRYGVKIGVENHKDFESPELVELLQRISSEHIGVCIDLGNSLALLEDPMDTVLRLAPFAMTTHVKDMAVKETPQGFLLSEVPLGQGILDLPKMLEVIWKMNPSIRLNLEMITRDPLSIPCVEPGYWATFPEKRGTQLAATLKMVRTRGSVELPSVSGKSAEAILAYEEENVLKSLQYAGQSLGLAYHGQKFTTNDIDEK